MEPSNTFGKMVKKLRNERRMTQVELAGKIGKSRRFIQIIERQINPVIKPANLVRLSHALGFKRPELTRILASSVVSSTPTQGEGMGSLQPSDYATATAIRSASRIVNHSAVPNADAPTGAITAKNRAALIGDCARIILERATWEGKTL